ncbi:Protein N-terminal and lysine N-methyltransferase efm7 [Thecaphora frezii]
MSASVEAASYPTPRSRKLSSKLSLSNVSTKSGTVGGKNALTPTQQAWDDSDESQGISHRRQSSHPPLPGSAGSKGTDGNTIAHLYAVFGLPKDPAVWTLAEEDCVAGVHHIEGAVGRFWRPEVLGCSISPPPSSLADPKEFEEISRTTSNHSSSKKDGTAWDSDAKKGSNPKFIEMSDGRGGIERAETARVLSKALKLSFTREIEVTAGPGNYPPTSTSHTFSFSVPTIRSSTPSFNTRASADLRKGTATLGVSPTDVHKSSAASAVGEGYGLEAVASGVPGLAGSASDVSTGLATFYGVVLTVWSAADEKRAKAIRKELNRAAKIRAGTRNGKVVADAEEGEPHEDEVDSNAHGYSFLPENNTFFMPYAICLVSRYPIYNLLSDWNKAAWHKYSRNIEMHNKLMAAILRQPAPRLGETFRLESPDEDLKFVCTFPGALDWGRGLISIDFVMWPLFKALSIDNVLTVCEIALSPAGRVLFLSRHPALLGVAVETVKYLIELCGWKGVTHQICHARDVKIYLEDPGSWLIALNTELRSIAKPAKEVCVVDLDINFVNCPRPPPKTPSTRSVRDKKRRKLVNALGFSSGDYGPPREITEAFPAGRLRPLSKVESSSRSLPYDRIDAPHWWDQGAVLGAFDQVLHEGTKPSFLKKVLKLRTETQSSASATETAAIIALRKRASTFVDARDGLENKIGRLNKRLAFLMSEGEMWKQQFEKIQQLVDRLTKEANDLRVKVDRERRESRRLSTTLQQRDLEQVQLQLQLRDTEQAREKAQAELLRMRQALDSLEHEREAMMDEIRNVVSSTGLSDFNVNSLSKLEMMAESARRDRSDSPGSAMSHNSELSILKSRALAEQRISMGHPRTASSVRVAGGSRLGHGSQSGHGAKEAGASGEAAAVGLLNDEQMNYEIQNRTSAVTDQISRIQQQLESTLTHLESRRSVTFDRERRRLSNASISSYRYEHLGPASSIGHHAPTGSTSSVHGGEHGYAHSGGAPTYEAVENIQDHRDQVDGRGLATPRRAGVAPPSSFRAPASTRHGSRPSQNVSTAAAAPAPISNSAPMLKPKHPARRASASVSTNEERDSPLASSSGHDLAMMPRAPGGQVNHPTEAPETMAPSIASSDASRALHSREASGSDQTRIDTPAAVAALPSQYWPNGIKEVSTAHNSTADTLVADAPKELKLTIEPPSDPATIDADDVEVAAGTKASTSTTTTTTDTADDSELHNSGEDDDDDNAGFDADMFAEPEGFRPKTPPPTVTYYDFPGSDAKLTLHLVGSHPLWGHLAWNASFVMADFLCAHANTLTKGRKVLELGAAAGLPSIVCNWVEASHVVASDYPDPDLLGNLVKNIAFNCGEDNKSTFKGPGYAAAEGFIWGTDPTKVLSHLSADGSEKFDLILLSDLVFNHQAHPALLDTCERCLADPLSADEADKDLRTPCVLVFFTHHRPHLANKDMGFFDLAEAKGWKVQKLGEWFREPMFPDDPGDKQVRSTIHGFRLYKGGQDGLADADASARLTSTD